MGGGVSSISSDTLSTFHGLEQVLQRLMQLIDEETDALLRHDVARCDEFNQRKRLALLDLSRCQRQFEIQQPDAKWLQLCATLRRKLQRNGELLHVHLTAVQEIAQILARTIADAESDGTYGVIRRAGRP